MTKTMGKKAQGLALLAIGSTVEDVVETTGRSKRTVYRWLASQEGHELVDVVKANDAKGDSTFLASLEEYMSVAIKTFIAHLEMSQRADWFEKHSPDKIAIFDGVHADKVFLILDALARREDEAKVPS